MERPPEYALYEEQPFTDLRGVPKLGAGGAIQDCSRPGCGGEFIPQPGTQHFDADGGAQVSTQCPSCGLQSVHYWRWTDQPPAENQDYMDSEESRS